MKRRTFLKNLINNIRNLHNLSDIKKYVVTETGKYFNADRCFIRMFDIENDKLLAVDKHSEYLSSPSISSLIDIEPEVITHVFLKKHFKKGGENIIPEFESNLSHDKECAFNIKQFIKIYGLKSDYGLPIFHKEKLIGAFVTHYLNEKRILQEDDINILRAIANHLAVIFYEDLVKKKLSDHTNKTRLLRKIASAPLIGDVKNYFAEISPHITKSFSAERVLFVEYDPTSNQVKFLYDFNQSLDKHILEIDFNCVSKTNLKNFFINNSMNFVINSLETAEYSTKMLNCCKKNNIKSILGRPVKIGLNTYVAMFLIQHENEKTWSKFEINLLKLICEEIAIFTRNINLYTQSDFISNIFHELKTPLSIINGYSEVAIDETCEKSCEIKKCMSGIQNNVYRINSLLDKFLYITKIQDDYEKNHIQLYEYNLAEIIDFAINTHYEEIKEKNLMLTVNCKPEIKISANLQLIESALSCILENAILHSHHSGLINIKVYQSPRELMINIKDNGIGIEKKHLKNIFEMFYRVDKSRSRKTGGAGLGLSIAKMIVHAHKGYISVKSEPNKGSTFSIHLPNV